MLSGSTSSGKERIEAGLWVELLAVVREESIVGRILAVVVVVITHALGSISRRGCFGGGILRRWSGESVRRRAEMQLFPGFGEHDGRA